MQQSAPAPVEAQPHQPKRVDLFAMLLGQLALSLQPRGRRITVQQIKPHVDDLVETLKTTALRVDAHIDEARR